MKQIHPATLQETLAQEYRHVKLSNEQQAEIEQIAHELSRLSARLAVAAGRSAGDAYAEALTIDSRAVQLLRDLSSNFSS